MRFWPILLGLALPVMAAEKAAYDSNGRIIAMLGGAEDVEISSSVVAVLPGGKRVPLQTRREGAGAMRRSRDLAWTVAFTLPDGGRGQLDLRADESAEGVRYTTQVRADSALEVDAIEFVLDLPRAAFVGGKAGGVSLAAARAQGPVLLDTEMQALDVQSARGDLALALAFEPISHGTLVDRWDAAGRSWQARVTVARGPVAAGSTAKVAATLRLKQELAPAAPVNVTVDASKARFRFDGFGGNYCWNNQSPVADYTWKNLKVAWARTEMKLLQWDKQRDNPGPELRADFERMRGFQQAGVPYVISIWWLPERLYTDPHEKPRSAHFRLIKADQWDAFLDLMGSYLLYAKKEYGVEPDLFSFNESNIGVYVGQTPETHTEALKRIGAHFRKLGLKTKMLLGDATGPRDTHRFVLDAAADPEALQYVGAVGFHSWGGGTPEQYAAWGEVAEWLKLPLLVTELGVDAAAYNGRAYDSYHYGLREAKMTLELVRYARPQGTQYWQFTNDYGLARGGETVEPSARFWLMKHFTDLTPQHSEAVEASSDQASVLVAAFRKDQAYTVHILNLGGERAVTLAGLPAGDWKMVESTEAAQWVDRPMGDRLQLPARSLVTLVATQPGTRARR
jgi:O-glycosyl hydrolase